MRTLFCLPVLATAAALASCGAESKSEDKGTDVEAPKAPFLSLSDFSSTSLLPIDGDSLEMRVNGIEDLQAPEAPQAKSSDSQSSSCDPKLEAVTISATADHLSVNFAADLTDCTQTDWSKGNGTAEVRSASVKIFVDFRCEGADLSVYDGKKMSDLETVKVDPCSDLGGTKATSLFNSESKVDLTLTISDKKSPAAKALALETVVLNDDQIELGGVSATEGCVRTRTGDNFTNEGTCLSYKAEKVASDPNNDTVTKVAKTGLTFSKGDQYFRTGKAGLDINGWTGDATFTAGDKAPTWSLQKDGETKTGTYAFSDMGAPAPKQSAEPEAETKKSPESDPVSEPVDKDTSTAALRRADASATKAHGPASRVRARLQAAGLIPRS